MKQVLQNLKDGTTEIAEVPCPSVRPGHLLVRTTRTLVSTGTERMLVDFGKAGWLDKAMQQPDKVRQVLEKVRTDGILPTIEAVRNKLDQPIAMGYCNVGVVAEIGEGVTGFGVGDRVVSNGKHAEVVAVPTNLCAKIPENVSDEEAVFTVVSAIGLQGIRLAQPTLGESVVVTGLGLIGLITVQLLKAQGCRVLGIDMDPNKLRLAREFGAEVVDLSAGEDPVEAAFVFSRGRGVDGVLITASTRSNEPVHQAALMSRKRGRIVLVGVTGLELSRADFYEKELTFQVSCSYGPGRYDPSYEERGNDYPIGFVRWTEQRNFEAVLDMLSAHRLEFDALISHRFSISEAGQAYKVVGGSEPSLGIVLTYDEGSSKSVARARASTVTLGGGNSDAGDAPATVGFIGSGNYAGAVLIPAFKAAGAHLHTIASASGVTSVHAGRKFGFVKATTNTAELLADPQIRVVAIATRHDSHASYVLAAHNANKHVFVEKPLCLTLDELLKIEQAFSGNNLKLMVGFNRRFAPHVRRIKNLLRATPGSKAFVMTVNAGAIPDTHWTQNRQVGGGRILGEGCHFIDLLRFLAESPIVSHRISPMHSGSLDSVTINLGFGDGSIGTIHYLSNGNKAFPKERLEVFAAGRVMQLDNFRNLKGYGWTGFRGMRLWRQDKGQRECASAFLNSVRAGTDSPIPLAEILEVSRVSIELQGALG